MATFSCILWDIESEEAYRIVSHFAFLLPYIRKELSMAGSRYVIHMKNDKM